MIHLGTVSTPDWDFSSIVGDAAMTAGCYQVVARNGGLAGFRYDLELKLHLLCREADIHSQEQ